MRASQRTAASRSTDRPDAADRGRPEDPVVPRTEAIDEGDERSDPWDQYGWVMRGIWLVFLIFPLVQVFNPEQGLDWRGRILAVGFIVGFAVLYVIGSNGADDEGFSTGRFPSRRSAGYLTVLTLITVGLYFLIGMSALGMMPFLLSFGMFAFPMAWSLGVAVAGLAVTIGLPLLKGQAEQWWFFSLIVLAIVVATAVMRMIAQRGVVQDAMRQQFAIVAERERVARDVHDVLGHSLTVVAVKAELAGRLIDIDPERAKAELAEVQSLSRQALAEIRATVGGLRVARLDVELESAASALRGAAIDADLPAVADISEVDPRHRVLFAWVLREAVTNVVRHSGADRCTVTFEPAAMTVTDDGRGVGDRPEGNGIRGLRERIDGAGGRLETEPGPDGRGTTLRVRM